MQDVPLLQLTPRPDEAEASPRRSYVRWRVASLIGVHVLAAIHIVHWRINGRTLAPLELNEVMYTLELGIITAGFVLMALLVLSVAVFGRFFCSWGCHILALQDLCAWILGKLRLRAKPVRSRVLLLVAPGAMLYMFVWPHVRTLIEGRSLPTFHLRDDSGGWASFVTDDFWRNLPGPWVALTTFAICGFVIVYVLGTRSFCQYACPYGAIFGIMDRFAPGRIKVDPDKCTSCGVCTGVCDSHVRVHEEIATHGSVVDPSCLKDLDCVTACPEQALSYGWTRPSLLRSFRPARRRLRYDFTMSEDLLMVAAFLGTLATFRGLYGMVPFLMALALGGMFAYLAVLCLRLLRSDNVRLNGLQFKLKGRITRPGRAFAVVAVIVWMFVGHSALIRHHEVRGQRALNTAIARFNHGADSDAVSTESRKALAHLRFVARWGLLTAPGHDRRVASACWGVGDIEGAERAWRHAIDASSRDLESRMDLAASFLQRERTDLAEPLLRELCAVRERSRENVQLHTAAFYNLGTIEARSGRAADAIARFRGAVRLTPAHAAAHFSLGRLLLQIGNAEEGSAHLRRAAELDPRFR